jgi:hypothetical protein
MNRAGTNEPKLTATGSMNRAGTNEPKLTAAGSTNRAGTNEPKLTATGSMNPGRRYAAEAAGAFPWAVTGMTLRALRLRVDNGGEP